MPTALAKRIATRARSDGRLVRRARLLALIFVIAGSLDVVSTNAALAAGHIEANPLVEGLRESLGAWWALPKYVFHVGLAWLILWIPSRRMLKTALAVNLGYLAIVLNNFHIADWQF